MDIIPILTGNSNTYLLPNGERSIVVDSGIPGMAPRILRAAQGAGLAPQDIALVVMTHTHYDHAGSLQALKAATGAKVLVHACEEDCLRQGFSPIPAGTNAYGKTVSFLCSRVIRGFGKFPAVEADILIDRRWDLAEYGIPGYVLPTPGHTAGSLCLVLEEGIALVGDTLFGIFPNSAYPPFANDQPELRKSWRLLLDTGCHTFLPGHGRAVGRKLLERGL